MAPGRDERSSSNPVLHLATVFLSQVSFLHVQIFPYVAVSFRTKSVHLPFFAMYYFFNQ